MKRSEPVDQNWHVTVGEGSNGHTYQIGPVIAQNSDEAWKAGQRRLKPGQWMISVVSVGPVAVRA